MVNVTKENFLAQSSEFINDLPKAAFIAIDEEMTGISVGKGRPVKDHLPVQRYAELKQAPERYSIIQFGVALYFVNTKRPTRSSGRGYTSVAPSPPTHPYTVKRYNFYTFPGPDTDREVVLNPGAVAFLHKNNMSFDLWSGHGVTHCIRPEAYLEDYIKAETTRTTTTFTTANRVELRRVEDIDFYARAMASLREWLDAPVADSVNEEGTSFLLPPCNSFLRRALYENIADEYPSLTLEKTGNHQIRVIRMTDQEKRTREERLKKERFEKLIVNQIGMYRVFEALRLVCNGNDLNKNSILFADSFEQIDWDGKQKLTTSSSNKVIPIVVHNGFMDLCFVMTHYKCRLLPDRYQDTKDMIHECFPLIYDTKVLSTESGTASFSGPNSLGNLYNELVLTAAEDDDAVPLVNQIAAPESDTEQAHEADYDAFMTGAVFIAMCHRIQQSTSVDFVNVISNPKNNESCKLYSRNKLYQLSVYTMDLEYQKANHDPMSRGMLPESTYRVAGVDKSVATRDIVRCLSSATDEEGRPVHFEIIWIDDTTFLVAASFRADNDTADVRHVLLDHGRRLYQALRSSYQKETIVALDVHLNGVESGRGRLGQRNTVLDNLLGVFGLTTKKRAIEEIQEAPRKRMRTS